MPEIGPYGSWSSLIDAAQTISKLVKYSEITLDGTDLYWLELRPGEGGRQVLVRRRHSENHDLVPAGVNVRTKVHEYGGGAYLASQGVVVYSDFADQRLYRLDQGAGPVPLTPASPRPQSLRYADAVRVGEVLVCVRESHPDGHSTIESDVTEASNELVAVDLRGEADPILLLTGRDFVASPRVSPDGSRLAWLAWDHPNMPWDSTELWSASFDGVSIANAEIVAGGPKVSVVQPEWGVDGDLYFSADPTGWWNLYRHHDGKTRPVLEMAAEFGFPQWVFGSSCYGFVSGGRIAVAFYEDGAARLGLIEHGGLHRFELDYSRYSSLRTDGGSRVFFVGYHPRRPSRIVEFNVDDEAETLVAANPDLVDGRYVPDPVSITFPTGQGEVAYGFYYPPTNPDFAGPADEKPPLRVEIHGGPTSATYPAYALDLMFWTSRGFGVVDINYRGSTGYGRAFRDRLLGNWGIVDVEDAIAAARHLSNIGLVDPARLTITGGSAGGYTTLAALSFHDVFAAGSSYYGIADLELLDNATHKFESRYEQGLVGSKEEMRRRSPIHHLEGFRRPVILLQGLEDQVVPPDQARLIAEALDQRGVPHSLVLYEGEDHGFRKAENIVHALESELSFFGKVLGFRPAGERATVEVRHLDRLSRS